MVNAGWNVGVRSHVPDPIDFATGIEGFGEVFRGNIPLDQGEGRVFQRCTEVGTRAEAEVIDADNAVAAGEQGIDKMTADESGCACDKDVHK